MRNRCWKFWRLCAPARTNHLKRCETLALNHAESISGCICVLLAWDRSRRRFVEKLKALDVPVRVIVVLAESQEQPLDPGPMQGTPEHFHTLMAGQIEQGLAQI